MSDNVWTNCKWLITFRFHNSYIMHSCHFYASVQASFSCRQPAIATGCSSFIISRRRSVSHYLTRPGLIRSCEIERALLTGLSSVTNFKLMTHTSFSFEFSGFYDHFLVPDNWYRFWSAGIRTGQYVTNFWYQLTVTDGTCSILLPAAGTKRELYDWSAVFLHYRARYLMREIDQLHFIVQYTAINNINDRENVSL